MEEVIMKDYVGNTFIEEVAEDNVEVGLQEHSNSEDNVKPGVQEHSNSEDSESFIQRAFQNDNPDSDDEFEQIEFTEWTKLEPGTTVAYKPDQFEDIYDHSFKNIGNEIFTEYDFFKLFITNDLLQIITANTNEYARHKKEEIISDKSTKEKLAKKSTAERWTGIDQGDIEQFIATYILMHIHKLPDYKDHWSKNNLLKTPVSDLMPRSKYEKIQSFLHPSKVGSIGKEKISTIINYINEKCMFYYYPSKFVTIDERMISYRGRSNYVMYENSKPTKWGFRPYILSDFRSGYTYFLMLFDEIEEQANQKMFQIVTSMMSILKTNNTNNKPHILAADGLYSSEELLDCEDFYYVGSIRKNRIKMNKDERDKKLDKNEWTFYVKGNSLLTKYMDKKLMYVISNCCENRVTTKQRWNKNTNSYMTISYPEPIKIYAEMMKGVDTTNQLIAQYELSNKTYKWWKRIFFHLLDVAIVNAYVLYTMKIGKITQKEFRLNLVETIKKRVTKPTNTKLFHLPQSEETRRVCVNCAMHKKKGVRTPTSKFTCIGCGVYLCIECFIEYHKLKYKLQF
jgi:hypothetical protein